MRHHTPSHRLAAAFNSSLSVFASLLVRFSPIAYLYLSPPLADSCSALYLILLQLRYVATPPDTQVRAPAVIGDGLHKLFR